VVGTAGSTDAATLDGIVTTGWVVLAGGVTDGAADDVGAAVETLGSAVVVDC